MPSQTSTEDTSIYRRMRTRLRPIRRKVGKTIGELKLPLRLARILPYVWQKERRERREFKRLRAEKEHLYEAQGDPLITVLIPTYNRAHLLAERAIPSILAQTYQNFEILVIGDCCSDNTCEVLASFNDPRIRYYNLPQRPFYPSDKTKRWMIVGYHALNTGQNMAQGWWISKLDDDDMYTPGHLEKMLRFSQVHNYEFASSQSWREVKPGEYTIKGKQPPLSMKDKTHSTYFWRAYLAVFEYEFHSWRAGWSFDKYMLRKYRLAGVRAGFLEEPTIYYMLSPDPAIRTSAR